MSTHREPCVKTAWTFIIMLVLGIAYLQAMPQQANSDVTNNSADVVIAQIQAETGKLATFGIVPTHSNIEYGYIQAESDDENSLLMHVKCFKEKPNIELADEYFKENTKLQERFHKNDSLFCTF